MNTLKEQGDIAIGSWPTPEKPHVTLFKDKDNTLIMDLNDVFVKHDLKGRIVRVEFDCGTPPPPSPNDLPSCFRVYVPGPDDKPYYIWLCFGELLLRRGVME